MIPKQTGGALTQGTAVASPRALPSPRLCRLASPARPGQSGICKRSRRRAGCRAAVARQRLRALRTPAQPPPGPGRAGPHLPPPRLPPPCLSRLDLGRFSFFT